MPPKRKSDSSTSANSSKKTHIEEDHTLANTLVKSILADPDNFPIPDDDEELRDNLIALAKYAQTLQGQIVSGSSTTSSSATRKTPGELEDAAEKIRKAAVAGIKKQMSWKPSCKSGSAKWSYDGICPDPEVFGQLLEIGGPPKFKMKKMSKEDFQDLLGSITSSARYSDLYITGKDVNIRWSDTGEFKFSGSYGVLS